MLAAVADRRPSGQEGARNLDEPQEAAVEAFRRSAEAVTVELLARYERLHTDAATLHRELADQIEIMRGLIDRMAQADELTSDPDLQAALAELDADLRLEKIEEREQLLGEREARLDRRERELAAFAAATQGRLS